MSKLNIDQKTVKGLFQDSKSDFLIPDYQRPYAWGMMSVKHFGKICSVSLFQMTTPTNSTTMTSIFSVRLSHSKMMTERWKL